MCMLRGSPLFSLANFCLASKCTWDGLLTPEGSEGVPTDLRILHDMIALLQENKIRKR